MEDIAPSLQQAKRDGKIRHMGISESAPVDPAHTMLERAVNEAHADDQRQPL
jgi:predicted oxidoreductase